MYLVLAFVLLMVPFYVRYVPVRSIYCKDIRNSLIDQNTIVLDIRDYNISNNKPVEGAINLPLPYFKRFSEEIPNKRIHLVASDAIEKNMGIRLLRKQGFEVTGYSLLDCPCSQEKKLKFI